MNKRMPAITML